MNNSADNYHSPSTTTPVVLQTVAVAPYDPTQERKKKILIFVVVFVLLIVVLVTAFSVMNDIGVSSIIIGVLVAGFTLGLIGLAINRYKNRATPFHVVSATAPYPGQPAGYEASQNIPSTMGGQATTYPATLVPYPVSGVVMTTYTSPTPGQVSAPTYPYTYSNQVQIPPGQVPSPAYPYPIERQPPYNPMDQKQPVPTAPISSDRSSSPSPAQGYPHYQRPPPYAPDDKPPPYSL